MAADALGFCIARASAAMILQDELVFVSNEEVFSLLHHLIGMK